MENKDLIQEFKNEYNSIKELYKNKSDIKFSLALNSSIEIDKIISSIDTTSLSNLKDTLEYRDYLKRMLDIQDPGL